MTHQEVREEIMRDYLSILMRIVEERESSRRKFLKATLFPVRHFFKFKSAQNNIWNIILTARFREERKRPGHLIFSIYENNGLGAYHVKRWVDSVVVFDFIPHFFKRYRERYLIPNGMEGLSIEKQVESFFLDGGMLSFDFRNQENSELIFYNKTGIMFGKLDPASGYICVKTYVHYSMFFEDQSKMMEFFAESRRKITSALAYFKPHKNFYKLDEEEIRMLEE